MANKETHELDSAGTLTGNEIVHIVQDGNSVEISLSQLAALLNAIPVTRDYTRPFRGALLKRNTNLNEAVWPLYAPWETAEYDTDSFWTVAAPTRITIPAGITKVRLEARATFDNVGFNGSVYCSIRRNGESTGYNNIYYRTTSGNTNNIITGNTPVIDVAEGDYFEVFLNVYPTSGGVTDVLVVPSTYFSVEVVEAMQ